VVGAIRLARVLHRAVLLQVFPNLSVKVSEFHANNGRCVRPPAAFTTAHAAWCVKPLQQ
jgi:hypothetical protein